MTPPVFPTNPASGRSPVNFPWPVAFTVFLITMITVTAITFILPETYSSTARVKVDMPVSNTNGIAYDPYFIQTEFEVIQSQVVLNRVIEKLKLDDEWGKKYFNGERLKTDESLKILKARLSLAPVRGTRLIAITCYSDDPREAAVLANSVAEAYQEYALDKNYPAGAVEIVDRAEPARQPSKPNKPLNIALGAVFGALAGLAVAALVWGFNSRRR